MGLRLRIKVWWAKYWKPRGQYEEALTCLGEASIEMDRWRRKAEMLACELASKLASQVTNPNRRFKVAHPKVQHWLNAAEAATKEAQDAD